MKKKYLDLCYTSPFATFPPAFIMLFYERTLEKAVLVLVKVYLLYRAEMCVFIIDS